MNSNNEKLPYGISEYIKQHFREDFLFEVKEVRKVSGQWYYAVEITKDNYIHTLRFNEKGELVNAEAEQAFPAENREGPAFEEIPE